MRMAEALFQQHFVEAPDSPAQKFDDALVKSFKVKSMKSLKKRFDKRNLEENLRRERELRQSEAVATCLKGQLEESEAEKKKLLDEIRQREQLIKDLQNKAKKQNKEMKRKLSAAKAKKKLSKRQSSSKPQKQDLLPKVTTAVCKHGPYHAPTIFLTCDFTEHQNGSLGLDLYLYGGKFVVSSTKPNSPAGRYVGVVRGLIVSRVIIMDPKTQYYHQINAQSEKELADLLAYELQQKSIVKMEFTVAPIGVPYKHIYQTVFRDQTNSNDANN